MKFLEQTDATLALLKIQGRHAYIDNTLITKTGIIIIYLYLRLVLLIQQKQKKLS